MWNVFEQLGNQENQHKSNVIADFLQNSGLYDTLQITSDNRDDLLALISGNVPLCSYCVKCGHISTFRAKPIMVSQYEWDNQVSGYILADLLRNIPFPPKNAVSNAQKNEPNLPWNYLYEEQTKILCFSYICGMDNSHRIEYVVIADATSICKIGQYPSVADLSFPELGEFKKVLSKQDMREMRRAIGLHAQGIGIGSYVYLRRIFERILDDAKNIAIMDGALKAEDYDNAHVSERIRLLKDYLPKALVDNQVFYGIVSRGIHQLSEEECINYFPVLQEFIYIILRQKDQMKKERESEARLSASLSKIASSIK